MSFMHCDNYSNCGEIMLAADTEHATEQRARAKGWHIWEGQTLGGQAQRVRLGPQCSGSTRRKLETLAKSLPGDQTLFEITATT